MSFSQQPGGYSHIHCVFCQQKRIKAELTAVTANPKHMPMTIWKTKLVHVKTNSLHVCRRGDRDAVMIWEHHRLVALMG